ncbi:MAG: glutamine amidotransferase [Gammaproteobacteria bacterium]|nr:glutamine amidotransferase [Gammaproteobacteria bacterium]
MSRNRAPVKVIRHVDFEGVGTIGDELADRGLAFEYVDPTREPVSVARTAHLVIVMGGPISVNDVDRFPYLVDEIELIPHRIANGLPTLGICLGAQLIARALGAAVAPMPSPEIGWKNLMLSVAGTASPLCRLASPVLHWHGEMIELPTGCETLASTPDCANQAFAVGCHTLALQFHIEVGPSDLERWLVGHVHELDHHGISVAKLRDDTVRYSPAAMAEGRELLSAWLTGIRIDTLDRSTG